MRDVPVEELLRNVPSAYKLVILASRRAFDIKEGSPMLVTTKVRNASQAALEEISQGKITFKTKQEK